MTEDQIPSDDNDLDYETEIVDSSIGLALMLIDRKLFETLFRVFRGGDPSSEECKQKALSYIDVAAKHRKMDPHEYLDLLSDFFCWLRELLNQQQQS